MTIAKDEIYRTGTICNPRTNAGRRHQPGKPIAIRQRHCHLHQQRQIRARILIAHRSRYGRSQRGRRCPHGLLPLRRLEELLFRGSACPRQRRRQLLHRAESRHRARHFGFRRRRGSESLTLWLEPSPSGSRFARSRCEVIRVADLPLTLRRIKLPFDLQTHHGVQIGAT